MDVFDGAGHVQKRELDKVFRVLLTRVLADALVNATAVHVLRDERVVPFVLEDVLNAEDVLCFLEHEEPE